MNEQPSVSKTSNARLATIDQLRETVLSAYFEPVPCRETLRAYFDLWRVPRFKANPLAKRGGGQVWYSVAHVEKHLRAHTIPGKLTAT